MNKEDIKQKNYISRSKLIIKKNTDKTYNIQAVAKMLGLPNNLEYDKQCSLIISYLNRQSINNKVIRELLDTIGYTENLCEILTKVLYELFSPSELPNKAPIMISNKKYKELLDKKQNNIITEDENNTLLEALNCKYCYCVKKLYLKNLFIEYITNKKPEYNPYAICTSSIYKNRNIDTPKKIAYSCRNKYDWYKKN